VKQVVNFNVAVLILKGVIVVLGVAVVNFKWGRVGGKAMAWLGMGEWLAGWLAARSPGISKLAFVEDVVGIVEILKIVAVANRERQE
jgi:hypothetical protein